MIKIDIRQSEYFSGLTDEQITAIEKIKWLAKKHHRLCEMDCNGVGYINGTWYYCGKIDDYARKQYGQGVQSAYIYYANDPDTTIFDFEIKKTEEKIYKLAFFDNNLRVEFQHDPRGATVKIADNKGKDLTPLLY
jgi:hypothetical protein